MPDRLPSPNASDAAVCEVLPTTALRVHAGVNVGDPLDLPATVCPGDLYRWVGNAPKVWISLTEPGPDGLRRIGPGSGVGREGDVVTVEARHLFLAADGVQADVLVLRHQAVAVPPTRLLLPLQPMCIGIDYTLILTQTAPGSGRLPDLACAGIGRGSRVMLGNGTSRPVEALRPGDRVLTRDHGAQPLRWAGQMTLRAMGAHAPVVLARGALGNAADLHLSQQSHLFLYNRGDAHTRARPETLIEARHLLGKPGICLREGGFIDYVVLVFDRHEMIYAEGIATESLLVTDATLHRLPNGLGHEVAARFPGLTQTRHFGAEAGRPLARPARRAGYAPLL